MNKICEKGLLLIISFALLLTGCQGSAISDEVWRKFLYSEIPAEQGYLVKINELQENGDLEAMHDLMQDSISKHANVDDDILAYEILKKQKMVKEASGADAIAIRVNGEEITKGDVDFLKVSAENRVNIDVLPINLQDEIKREIIKEVRTRMVSAEAKSRGYKPKQEEVDEFFETQKKFQEEWLDRLKNKGYESVYEITDEYWEAFYESIYLMFQRSMLYDFVIESNLEKINNEERERKIPIDDIKEEYWQKFIDELVSKSKIEIIDPKIKALFGVEYDSTTDGSSSENTPKTPETQEDARFIDIGTHVWARDAINALADEDIIKGTSENTFSPLNNITRADFALLLVRAFELSNDNTENFADVAESDYFAKEIAIARNTGIINGIGDNRYAPKNTITRQDMMLIVYRALAKLGVGIKESDVVKADTYEDFSEISDYAKEAVTALVNAGLVNGKNGLVAPTEYTTRAEVAVLLKRILDYSESI